jgi:hypothetical protein
MRNTIFGRPLSVGSLVSLGLLLFGSLAGCGAGGTDSTASAGAEPVDQSSEALSSYDFEYEYYSDSSYSKEVGYWYRTCSGQSNLEGKRTKYALGSKTDCRTGATVGCWEIINEQEYCGYLACVIC